MTLEANSRLRWLAASVALYLASLALPAFHFDSTRQPLAGYAVLGWGWLGPLAMNFAWFANPVLWASWWGLGRGNVRRAFPLSVISLLVSLQSPFAKEWWFNEGSGTAIERLGAGFYLWLAAILVALVGSYRLLPEDDDARTSST